MSLAKKEDSDNESLVNELDGRFGDDDYQRFIRKSTYPGRHPSNTSQDDEDYEEGENYKFYGETLYEFTYDKKLIAELFSKKKDILQT